MTREVMEAKNKKVAREIVNAVADYFDADNIEIYMNNGNTIAKLYSNEDLNRIIQLERSVSGTITINVDYQSSDSTIRLYEIEIVASGLVTRFKALTPDITYPEDLVKFIKEALGCWTVTE